MEQQAHTGWSTLRVVGFLPFLPIHMDICFAKNDNTPSSGYIFSSKDGEETSMLILTFPLIFYYDPKPPILTIVKFPGYKWN